MTNEEAIKYLIRPFATSTKSYNEYLKQREAYELAIRVLEETVNIRPKGKWIEHVDEKWGGVWYTCSNCCQNALYERDEYNIWRQKLSDFCPKCGADMRGDKWTDTSES